MAFPFLDLVSQYRDLKAEIDAAVGGAFAAGAFIMGPQVESLEKELAAAAGTAHAAGVDSGTRALELVYRALGIGPGDEVITTPFTFVATVATIAQVGATPVFADIDPLTMNIDPAEVKKKITPRTKAITPVHLFGLPADMDALLAVAGGIPVVEDACQAIGATYKGKPVCSLGRAAAMSFYPTKNLGGAGDGGAVYTDDPALDAAIRNLRNHGSSRQYVHDHVGCTGRLDALQAAVLRVKLPHLARWNAARQANALAYNEAFAGLLETPAIPADRTHVFHQYTLRVEAGKRDALVEHCKAAGVPVAVFYPVPQHRQEAYLPLGHAPGSFPRAEAAAASVFSLPCCPYMTQENRAAAIAAVRSFFGK